MRRLALVGGILVLAASIAVAEESNAIVGLWSTNPKSDVGKAHVEIYGVGETFEGKIVWLEIPVYEEGDPYGEAGAPKVDTENPDPALRSRPVVGLRIMTGFRYAGDGNWVKGRIYDPENGKTYKCKIRMADDGSLKVRGYIGVSLLGRTEIWTPVSSEVVED